MLSVPKCVCESGTMFIFSSTIKRVIHGFTEIHLTLVSNRGLPPALKGIADRFNSQALWEEKAHQAAAHRWLRDHQETGYGFGCDLADALEMAQRMAQQLVTAFETAALAGYNAENLAIDLIGHVQRALIERDYRELVKKSNGGQGQSK
jgi:hypothetical protein